VRINRDKIDSASHPVKVGDALTIGMEAGVRVLRVLATGTRRGPATEARLLYEDLSPPAPPEAVTGRAAYAGGRPRASAIAARSPPSSEAAATISLNGRIRSICVAFWRLS